MYLDIIELELYPARLPHLATLPLQSVRERERVREMERKRLKKVKKELECVKCRRFVCSLFWLEAFSVCITIDVSGSKCSLSSFVYSIHNDDDAPECANSTQ